MSLEKSESARMASSSLYGRTATCRDGYLSRPTCRERYRGSYGCDHEDCVARRDCLAVEFSVAALRSRAAGGCTGRDGERKG